MEGEGILEVNVDSLAKGDMSIHFLQFYHSELVVVALGLAINFCECFLKTHREIRNTPYTLFVFHANFVFY